MKPANAKKKKIHSFSELLAERKKNGTIDSSQKEDWANRKRDWLIALDQLYAIVDEIVVHGFKQAGYEVNAQKETVLIFEDFIGSYNIENYIIRANDIEIKLIPIGTIILGGKGKVNLLISGDTIKLILQDWGKWRITKGFGSEMELVPFNEEHLIEALREHL